MRSRHLVLSLAAATISAVTLVHADDWPHWRGPRASGVAPDASLPTRWSATENIAWKAPIAGAGVSTPIVSGDRVFVTSQIGTGVSREGNHPRLVQGARCRGAGRARARRRPRTGATADKTFFVVEAFDRADGKRVWERRIEADGDADARRTTSTTSRRPARSPTARSSMPGSARASSSRSIATAAVVWQRHLGKENGAFDIQWGHGSSPVLHGDLLILLCDQPARSYLARDRQEDRQGSLEGRPRPGPLVLQHAARRRGARSAAS